MKIKIKNFQFTEGSKINLEKLPTIIEPFYDSKAQYKEFLEDTIAKSSKQQRLLYASHSHAVLFIFQAMDSAGKDGVIRHVMSGINPQGCQVFSFSHPTATELKHDFLWRASNCLPERGRVGIFNRSYYEEVLIVKVHPKIIQAQNLPADALDSGDSESIWEQRYESIRGFEQHLHRNGTRVVKIFLHLSKEEQRQRFLARIDNPEKNWKFTEADINERKHWDKYMKTYQECMSATSSSHAPWYIIPADDKRNARLVVAQIVLETLESLKMSYPESGADRLKELKDLRAVLEQEAP
jgi:PPK2 family polyphosphate:nucleotide phosphotransferase